ncbi:Amino-acid acetyltransferase, mitochondrial [Frankliniella fusca]|uniref:Amino-acid acetyltransferase, mitochondrial n=1 Tax=Frankliniella fusca TaxID=407009 RepID=A0AAE1GSY0_9NEOP|nr:Amino-acid acetyltransferase, mitochondrial [Frankliniella fusca]
MTGNTLFELSYKSLPSTFSHLYFRPEELCPTLSFPENEITFQVQINEVYDGTSINNIVTQNNDGLCNYCVHDAILCYFHDFKFGVFTCQVQCIAIMKINNEYYIFDSHKRGKNGLPDGTYGTAVLISFTDTNEVVQHLKALFSCTSCRSAANTVCHNCQFSITPLLVTNVKNTGMNAEGNFSQTSEASNCTISKLQLARDASNKKLLQKVNKVPITKQREVKSVVLSTSTADLINKVYDLRIHSTKAKYERSETMKEKNNQQICSRYKNNTQVQESKRNKVREKYQTNECFKDLHSTKMREKYNTNELFKVTHSTNMKLKYQTNENYHEKVLVNVKNSYRTSQGAKRKSDYQNLYQSSKKTKICLHERFNEQKKEMPTVICTCCAQLFFKKSTVFEHSLKIHKSLSITDVCTYRHHLGENETGNVCSTCANHLKKGNIPHFAAKNGLVFDPLPQELRGLTTLEERLVSARIPFMQIRELGYQKQLGLKGNCVNVPIDINKTVTCLPRMDSEDDTLLVQLMRRMSDKTPYAFENVRPEKVFNAARYLVNTDLYKQHNITLNESWLQQFHDETNNTANDSISTSNTDDSNEQADEIDDLMDQQETLLTSGFVADSGVKIAPGEGNMPLSLTLDEDMDVLAFPTVYGGKQRIFKKWQKQRPGIMIDGLQQTSLKDKNGPFHPYEVDNDFFRIELQFRGSLHFHCIVWLKDAPEFDPQDPESYKKCEKFIDSFVTCKKDETLGELMNLQFHRCTRTCEKNAKGNTSCRFNYPLPPMREIKILLPLSNDMSEQEKLKARRLWSDIKEQTEIIAKNHEDCSFDEYLASLNVDEQSYIQALRSKLKRPTVFLGRNLNERRVNAYNREMLTLWEAHMDIQLVVSPYGCVKYIVSYVSKSQKGMSKLLKEVADKVAKADEPTIKKLRKIVNAF